jgi:hypothetical protein
VRRHLPLATVVLVAAAAACSSGSGDAATGNVGNACVLITRLDDTAATVARANVADPAAFKRTLDNAVKRYVDTIDALRPLVPLPVQGSLDRLAADVQQRRFDDAAADRAPLDAYATTACGRTTTTTKG